uniref:Uncharacterized protein n=1 Tax=Heterorhabditis bacteriophora TaxID=37862 RepID=A0A1I7XNT8_HETBA
MRKEFAYDILWQYEMFLTKSLLSGSHLDVLNCAANTVWNSRPPGLWELNNDSFTRDRQQRASKNHMYYNEDSVKRRIARKFSIFQAKDKKNGIMMITILLLACALIVHGGNQYHVGPTNTAVGGIGGSCNVGSCGPDFNPVLLQGQRGYPGIRARLNARAFQYASGILNDVLNTEIKRARIPPITQCIPQDYWQSWWSNSNSTSNCPDRNRSIECTSVRQMIPGQICGQLPSIINEKLNSKLSQLPQAIAVSQMLSMFGGALGLGGPTPSAQYVCCTICQSHCPVSQTASTNVQAPAPVVLPSVSPTAVSAAAPPAPQIPTGAYIAGKAVARGIQQQISYSTKERPITVKRLSSNSVPIRLPLASEKVSHLRRDRSITVDDDVVSQHFNVINIEILDSALNYLNILSRFTCLHLALNDKLLISVYIELQILLLLQRLVLVSCDIMNSTLLDMLVASPLAFRVFLLHHQFLRPLLLIMSLLHHIYAPSVLLVVLDKKILHLLFDNWLGISIWLVEETIVSKTMQNCLYFQLINDSLSKGISINLPSGGIGLPVNIINPSIRIIEHGLYIATDVTVSPSLLGVGGGSC